MILAIDIGNSQTTIGCLDGGDIPHVFRLGTDVTKTDDEYASMISGILDFHRFARNSFTGSVIASVVPPLTGVMKSAALLLTGHDAIVVGAGIKTGMNILIDDPAQLGSDMVATAVAALASYPPPVIIADMGTATKITVLNTNGGFIGGAILPGVGLSMDALAAGTSQLPRVPIDAPPKCISTNTVDCMKSGAVFGAAAMIDGMAARFEAELGAPAQIVATGGYAGLVYRHCHRDVVYDPYLLLRGLGIIYEKNKKERQ